MPDLPGEVIYLDCHATTPCDPKVVEVMLPYFSEVYANASSTSHAPGREVAEAVTEARSKIADLVGANPQEIIYTSGATESNNLAILGIAAGIVEHTHRRRIVTATIEHKAVLEPCQRLVKEGFEVVFIPVDRVGRVDLADAEELINDHTLLVSVQAANNEIGTIQPIRELAKMAHDQGALFHCDAAQALGKIPVNVDDWDVDLLSMSAHKFYGPKGVGALYVRGGSRGLPFKPLVLGGGQESGVRPGTLNVPGIVGMGKACELCMEQIPIESQHLGMLRDEFEAQLLQMIPGLQRNGDLQNRLPNTSSLTFRGIDAEAFIANTPELAISTGSACTSGALEPSHVLLAIGMTREEAYSTIRVGLGRFSTHEELVKATSLLVKTYTRLIHYQ